MKLFEEFFDDIEQDELIDSNSSEDITIEDLDKEIYLYDDNNEINLNKLDLFFNHCIYITDYLIKQDDYKIIIDFNGYMTIKEATKFCNIFNRYIDYSIFDYLISPVIIDKEFIQSRYSNGTLDLSGVVFDNGAFFIENYIDDYINIDYIDLRKADTSKLVYLSFKNLENLKEIYGIEDIDVSNLKTTSSMFYDCNSLTSLNLNKWNVSNVKETKHMFYRCESLKELNINTWDVSNVKNMDDMFTWCVSLT